MEGKIFFCTNELLYRLFLLGDEYRFFVVELEHLSMKVFAQYPPPQRVGSSSPTDDNFRLFARNASAATGETFARGADLAAGFFER